TNSEIMETIATEITIWQAGDDFVFTSDFEHFTLPRDVIQFDIDATMQQYNQATKRSFSSFFKKQKNAQVPLTVRIDEDHEAVKEFTERKYIDTKKALQTIEELASGLGEESVSIAYLEEDKIPLIDLVTIEVAVLDLSNAVLTYAVDELDGLVIGPEETFSLIHAVDFPEALVTTAREMSFLGSVLYQVFLQTDFDVIERHAHTKLPDFAEAGLDAEVIVDQEKDFVVHNEELFSYRLTADLEADELKLGLQAATESNNFEYEQTEIEEIEQRTVFRYSTLLEPGEEQVIQNGRKGLTLETYRHEYDEDGMFIDS